VEGYLTTPFIEEEELYSGLRNFGLDCKEIPLVALKEMKEKVIRRQLPKNSNLPSRKPPTLLAPKSNSLSPIRSRSPLQCFLHPRRSSIDDREEEEEESTISLIFERG